MKKFLLFKIIFISSLVTTSTICITSCSRAEDVQVQYFLDGGSSSLQGKTSTAGQDEGVWKLFSESQEIESGITWKLTSATAEELPDSIRINDGVVSWTDQIETGTYQFYVVATYNDKEVKTNEINLMIHTYVLKNDLEETVLYYDKSGYEEPKCLKNWYLYDEIDQTPIPSFKCKYMLETFGYSSVFSIDKYGYLSWNKNIASKNFKFQVICLYENVEVCSEIYTLSVIDTSIFSYVLNDDNYSYTIFSHKSFNYGEFNVLNLPSKYLNLPINKIGDNFLSDCSSFNPTEFNIPNNLQAIGDNFLSGCSSFNPTEFTIPNNLQTIGNNFLSGCSSFNPTEFTIPNNLQTIGDSFLSGCSAFNSKFFIPQYVLTIGDSFLSGCSSFNPTEFTIPYNFQTISNNFLSGCSSFNPTEFTIPIYVQTIGNNFLSGCSSFNPTEFTIVNDTMQTIGDNFLSGCSSFNPTEFTIPIHLQTIGNNFLSDCSAFNSKFFIPRYVLTIGDNFLSGCSSFNPTEFIIPNNFLHTIGDNFLSGCSSFNPTEFTIPNNLHKIGDNFLSGCSSFSPTEFTIPETISYIGGGLFYNCYSINCLKVMCSTSSLQSSKLSFSVDDMTRDVYKNGLQVFVKTKSELDIFLSTFVNIYDVENKIFRHLNIWVI